VTRHWRAIDSMPRAMPDENAPDPRERDPDDAPETPLDEPRPPRVEDPPPQPGQQGPYTVRAQGS
jgi:hypothetical protein